MRYYINSDWTFTEHFTERFLSGTCGEEEIRSVNLPHTCKEITYNYCEEELYQMVAGYQKAVVIEESFRGKRLILTFEGAAHEAKVYINGTAVTEHCCGYTAFSCDITDYVVYGDRNVITVRLDTRETLNQPPFGNVIDYMTYGGIYRDVYLEVKEPVYIQDVFVTTPKIEPHKELTVEVALNQEISEGQLQFSIRTWGSGMQEQKKLGELTLESERAVFSAVVQDVRLWELEHPILYELVTELVLNQQVVDQKITRFGFRTAVFKKDGFYLNGHRIKIRGLNRHQSYPYVGYAMPKSMQVMDAEILKNDLCVNAVRTSHYPQSQYFIDRCDELGLLVFTEIPGWQHIGDEHWKQIAVQNVEEMVLQYRNHPSIILWGVRINESQDDHTFYEKTNAVCRQLDPSRQTGGVRCLKKSELLEDVYTYNDFVHEGDNEAVSKKKQVTSNMDKPYLISEYNGHMYPTKAFDDEKHRLEHTLRHARVLNEAAADDEIAGSFGWCMFDYNTHRDFGSGDRICYHGVMDMFRNPKQAAAVYQCQGEEAPVLEISSTMDIGEYPGGVLGDIYLFTNADSVKMYKNNELITEYQPTVSEFKHLAHGPIRVSDFVGNQLVDKEGYSEKMAAQMKILLADTMKYGLSHLPWKTKLIAARLILFHGMKLEDGVQLYNKYISGWGDVMKTYRFDAIKAGKVVKSITKAGKAHPHLKVELSKRALCEETTYDVAAVRITARDCYDNLLPYDQEPVSFRTDGDIALIGPSVMSLKGGMGGTYIKSLGKSGTGTLYITDHLGQEQRFDITVTVSKRYQTL